MNEALSQATTISQQSAKLAPAPAATPFTAAITGFSIFLIFLFGCKELYFKYPQPRGGKVFNGNLKQMFISAIPTTINSN